MRTGSGTPGDWARFHPGPVDGVTLMDAHFTEHAFDRHSHETYSIGLTHTGVQAFRCGGTLHASLPGDLILFNPDEAHDGQRGAPEGFGYSILYVPTTVVQDCADASAGLVFPRYFRRPVVRDRALARRFGELLRAAGQGRERLRAETLTRELLIAILARHGESGARPGAAPAAGRLRMARVRDYLVEHHAEDVSVQSLAAIAGLSRVHLSRAFAQAFGVPPHVFLNAVRLRHAQQAMLHGVPLAEAAAASGFADQSHLSRRFKGAFGTTPAQWLRQMRGRIPP